MAADFEEEGRLANETVTRQSSNPNVMLGGVAVLAAAVVIGLMWYASGRKQTKPQNAGDESFATARLQPGATFDRPAQKDEPAKFVIPAPPVTPPVPQPAVVVAPAAEPRPDDSEARRLEELERLRKEAEAKLEARLRSPMLAINDREGTASRRSLGAGWSIEKDEEDPNRRFLRNAENDVTRARAVKHTRIDALVPQGFMIRGVLETGIQSDLPGNVRASVSEDVYSFDGRRVLIPKGTMLTGEYRSGVVARPVARLDHLDAHAARRRRVADARDPTGPDNLGRSGLDGRSGHAFSRSVRKCGPADAHGRRRAIRRVARAKSKSRRRASNMHSIRDGPAHPVSTGTPNQTLLSARQIGAQSASQASREWRKRP